MVFQTLISKTDVYLFAYYINTLKLIKISIMICKCISEKQNGNKFVNIADGAVLNEYLL